MPKITEEKKKCIESMLEIGRPYRNISRECGVSLSTVVKYAALLREEKKKREMGSDTHEAVAEEDVRFIMDAVRQRLDPKHPIMTKWVSDVSWWTHLVLDFSKLALPDILRRMSPGEIDLRNPEATARAAAAKLRAALEELEEREKSLGDLEEKIRILEEENRALREQLEAFKGLYDEAVEEAKKMIADLRNRTRELVVFVVRYAPQSIPEPHRTAYLSTLVPKLRELFG